MVLRVIFGTLALNLLSVTLYHFSLNILIPSFVFADFGILNVEPVCESLKDTKNLFVVFDLITNESFLELMMGKIDTNFD